jgi:hypothetical protein
MLLSVKEFADQVGVSTRAVHKAIEQGRLVNAVKTQRGKIALDPTLALTEWQATLQRPSRSKMTFSSDDVPSKETPDFSNNTKDSQ